MGAEHIDDTGEDADDPRGERRAPIVVAMLAAIALPFLMPSEITSEARWVVSAIEAVLLVAMLVLDPGRIDRATAGVHRVRLALITVLAAGAAFAAARLATVILTGSAGADSPSDLFLAGGLVWIYLMIAFAFVYWELDGGGPGERIHHPRPHPDLLFPQHADPSIAPDDWRPVFVDYLYVAFTTAIGFGPADTVPLARWAKLAMAVQAMASLVVIGLVLARAVNILAA